MIDLKWLCAVVATLVVSAGSGASAMSIKDSPHNLSVGSSAFIKANTEDRICIFCHTPHSATKLSYDPAYTGPLWNREENLAVDYTPYQSDTIAAAPGQPSGASRLCLSCHDGTIALPARLGAPIAHRVTEVVDRVLAPEKVLGKDLRDDHPISIEYFLKPGEFQDPNNVRLLKPREAIPYIECTSCHDPHNNDNGKFLTVDISSQKDALCTTCHLKAGWQESSHMTGGARYPSVANQVNSNGCMNCHTPHGAQRGKALLKLSAVGADIDTNCYTGCHNGGAAYGTDDLAPGVGKTHGPGGGDPDRHENTEALPLSSADKHVHCIDCHNPHRANFEGSPLGSTTPDVAPASQAPDVNGPLKGVRGVSIDGNQLPEAAYEYEICFRCHSGPQAAQFADSAPVQRTYGTFDGSERERFNTATSWSSHPVFGFWAGGESLRSDLPKPAHIYCSSCHSPHGSTRDHLLRFDNPDTFSQAQPVDNYPLCYSCHSEEYLMSTDPDVNRRKMHRAHVYGEHNPASLNYDYRAACSACHDPHGVPMGGGSSGDNSAFLVNFDRRYVPPPAFGNSVFSAVNRSCSISGPGESARCHAGAGPYSYNPYPVW